MDNPRDPAVEEQERLEQFLAWRRATGRGRRARRRRARRGFGWRWVGFGVGFGVLGGIFVALSMLLNGDLRDASQRLAVSSAPVSTESVEDGSRLADLPNPSSGASISDPVPSASPSAASVAGPALAAVNEPSENAENAGPRPGPDSTQRLAPAATPVVPSLPEPELSLPDRPSRAEQRPPPRIGPIGEAVRPSARPFLSARLPSLDYSLDQPEVPAAAPSPPPQTPQAPSLAPAPPAVPSPSPTPDVAASVPAPRQATPSPAPPASREPKPISDMSWSAPAPQPAPRQNSAVTEPGDPAPAARAVPAEEATAPPDPSPPSAAPAVTSAPVPPPEVAVKPFPEPIETLKQLMESIQNGKVGRTILRWVNPDRGSEPSRSSPDR